MKKEKNVGTKDESQIQNGFQDTFASSKVKLNRIEHRTFAGNKDFNIFLIQNNGKAPPGRPRSPGGNRPDRFLEPVRSYENVRSEAFYRLFTKSKEGIGPLAEEPFGNTINIEYKTNFNKKQISNFYKHLIFKIMKKQIFILVFLLLAAFANVTTAYGQCAEDALHPIAGKDYTYSVTASGGGTLKSFQWLVTKTPAIVAGGVMVSDLGSGYTLTNGTTATATINWNAATIADALIGGAGHNYYVVVKYVATSTAGCDVENIKAFKILPVNMFQIDLANWTTAGAALVGTDVCTSPITSATITDAGATATIAYNYGITNMYVKVTARNFATSWDMTVNRAAILAAAAGAGESAKLYYGTAPTIASASTEITAATTTIAANTPVPTDDEVIYLRLEVTHGTFEGLTAESFNITVDGVDTANNPDVSSTCTAEADAVTQTILERPTVVNNGTTVGNLLAP